MTAPSDVGRIAHDLNNVIGVIINYARFASDEIGADSPAQQDLAEISTAGDRAAALTAQLLKLARPEPMQAQVTDLNRTLAEIEPQLRGSVRDRVRLETVLTPGLAPVDAVPTLVGRLLAELAAAASDALPDGGRLGIATANTEVDAERYVRIGVEIDWPVSAVADAERAQHD